MAGRFLAEASGDAPLPGRAARAPDIFLAVDTISSGMGRMFSATSHALLRWWPRSRCPSHRP